MTREEAIDIMKAIIYMLEPMYDTDRVEDAVGMAIKALKQQDRIMQILDDCDLEAWEVLEKIKEVVRV